VNKRRAVSRSRVANQFGIRNWLYCLIGLVLVVKLVGLTTAPPGFFLDEAIAAANAICLKETGRSESNVLRPIFFPAPGTVFPPTLIYFNALWSLLFGDSPWAFRLSAAFFSVLSLAGVYKLVRLFASKEAALLAVVLMGFSPPLFQFGRIAWEASQTPAFLIWGMYFFFRSSVVKDGMIAGVLMSLAAYSYSPARAFILPFLPLALLAKVRRKQFVWSWFFAVILSFLIISIPLIRAIFDADLQSRFDLVIITNPNYLAENGGSDPLNVLRLFIWNLLRHLSPQFLFLTGDINPRHSTQIWGEISLPELVTLFTGFAFLICRALRDRSLNCLKTGNAPWALFFFLLFFLGLVPAALTWESVPHALRGICAWPFIGISAALFYDCFSASWREAKPIIIGSCFLFALFFYSYYFAYYPITAESLFDVPANKAFDEYKGQKMLPPHMIQQAKVYSIPASRYHMMRTLEISCNDSRALL